MSELTIADMKKSYTNPSNETPTPTEEAPAQAEAAPVEEEVVADKTEPSEVEQLKKELESTSKRLDDNRKNWHQTYQVARDLLNKSVEDGSLTQEEANEKLTAIKAGQLEVEDNPLNAVVEKFNGEVGLVANILGYDSETTTKYTEAFQKYANLNPEVMQEVYSNPTVSTKIILERGKEFSENIEPVLSEHGNVANAIKALTKKPDMDVIREEIRQELLAEMKKPATRVDMNSAGTGISTAPKNVKPIHSLSELKKLK